MSILVTGTAGFIGYHVSAKLLDRGTEVIGIDNINDYYDVNLKHARLAMLQQRPGFQFSKLDVADYESVKELFGSNSIDTVVHLAAQAGVRYSLQNPHAYINSNIQGFLNLLEACRHRGIRHLIYASSSSVYGAVTQMPFSVHQNVDHPVSLYAATKKSNELMAHCYSHLFRLPTTGLRFFTVYGPWGRPDMALFLFTKAILAGEPICIFNHGDMRRDFTYVDDVAEAVVALTDAIPPPNPGWRGDAPDPGSSLAPYRLYNIGNSNPVELLRLVELLEAALGRKAVKRLLPLQPGDVPATYADVEDLKAAVGFAPRTSIEDGIERFVQWYRDFYRV
jgi:UDP-glucuronate 4-epimerase